MAKNDYPKELYVWLPNGGDVNGGYFQTSLQELIDNSDSYVEEGEPVLIYELKKVGKLGLSVVEETPKKK